MTISTKSAYFVVNDILTFAIHYRKYYIPPNIPPLVDVSVSLAVDTPDLQAHAVLHIILQTRDLDLQGRKHAPGDIQYCRYIQEKIYIQVDKKIHSIR